jgi:hypothetical protein
VTVTINGTNFTPDSAVCLNCNICNRKRYQPLL